MSEMSDQARDRIRAVFGLNQSAADEFRAALMTIDDLVGFPPEQQLEVLETRWREAME